MANICTVYELYKSFEISMGWDVCLKVPPEISKDRDVCFLTDNPMLKLHGYTQGYTCAMHILHTHFACRWYNKCAQHIRPSWVDIVFISCTTCITCTKICCNGSCNGCTKTCCNGCTRSLRRHQWVGMLAFNKTLKYYTRFVRSTFGIHCTAVCRPLGFTVLKVKVSCIWIELSCIW